MALKEVKIRGEIRSIIDYATEMIQHDDFVGNNIHTGWLDNRIASHVRPLPIFSARLSTCILQSSFQDMVYT